MNPKSLINPLAMRVVARLRRGPGRFNQIERDTMAPSPFALSSVLKKLCRDGLVLRAVLKPDPPAHCQYSLTELGRDYAESACCAMLSWLDGHAEQIEHARAKSHVDAEADRARNLRSEIAT
jgi:DNA-binding HxlR family transcriptional regulator